MSTAVQYKRSRKDRNSTEILIDKCLSQVLEPYMHIPNYRLVNGGGIPTDFARSTTNVFYFMKKKQRIDNMLAERSPQELLAVFNMTKE